MFEDFFNDFVEIQLEKLSRLKFELASCSPNDKEYIKGQIMGYYDSLDVLKSQARSFGIKVDKLAEVDLEMYLRSE